MTQANQEQSRVGGRASDVLIEQMMAELREHIADEREMQTQIAALHEVVYRKPDPERGDAGGLLYHVTKTDKRLEEVEDLWRSHRTFFAGFIAGITALVTFVTDLVPRVIAYFRH